MTDQIREQMSALLDGELAPGELGLLVRRMERDAELRRAFGNYVLAGESMRAPGGITASPGFATRVSAALDDGEVVPNATPARAPRAAARFKRPLAGVAVAAGAALAAVLLVRPGTDGGSLMVQRAAPPAMAGVPMPGGASPTPAQTQRLVGFLVAHGQYASPIGRRNAWSNALAADPGINVVYEAAEKR